MHHVALAGQRQTREAVGHGLAEGREIGDHAVQTLRAAQVPAEAGDHLVEHQHRAVGVAERDQLGEEPGRRLLDPRRLEDHRGDLAGVRGEQGAQRRQIVVAELHGLVVDRARDAAVGRGRADEPVVVGEERVIGADRDQLAAGRAARELERRRGRGRAVLGELHHLGAVDQAEERLGALELEGRGPGEVGAELERRAHRLDHRGIGVAERDRAQAHAVLDELVAVDVPDVAALAARDQRRRELRVLVVALGVGVAAARHERAQPRGELLSTGKLHRPAPGLATTRGDGPSGAPIVTPRGSIM